MEKLERAIEDYIKRGSANSFDLTVKELSEGIENHIEGNNGFSRKKLRETLDEIEFTGIYNTEFRPSKKQKRLKRLEKLKSFLY